MSSFLFFHPNEPFKRKPKIYPHTIATIKIEIIFSLVKNASPNKINVIMEVSIMKPANIKAFFILLFMLYLLVFDLVKVKADLILSIFIELLPKSIKVVL